MFADDIVLCGGKEVDMMEYLETWMKAVEESEMRVSWPNTLFMDFSPQVKILGEVDEYRGGRRCGEGDSEMSCGAVLVNWKRCSVVLCDKRMRVKPKGKVYRTVVRPAMLYGAETWATTEQQEAMVRCGCWDGCAGGPGRIRSGTNTFEERRK